MCRVRVDGEIVERDEHSDFTAKFRYEVMRTESREKGVHVTPKKKRQPIRSRG